jgi:hypothetical protein
MPFSRHGADTREQGKKRRRDVQLCWSTALSTLTLPAGRGRLPPPQRHALRRHTAPHAPPSRLQLPPQPARRRSRQRETTAAERSMDYLSHDQLLLPQIVSARLAPGALDPHTMSRLYLLRLLLPE